MSSIRASVPLPARPTRHRRAMTLLEILVVVGIIALLVAILLPSLIQAREQARDVACRSNIKQLVGGAFYYSSDYKVLPGTHSLFFFQTLFGTPSWPRKAGVTWEGAADALEGLTYHEAYSQPHQVDPKFINDVPRTGTIFRYTKQPKLYTCTSDKPGPALDTPAGGGGNGRLSYSMNAYVGYKGLDQLNSFTYAADSLNCPLPGGKKTRSFKAGQKVVFSPGSFMLFFEEHPNWHMNSLFPEGNFNCIDRIATRHSPTSRSNVADGRTSIGFLDGHVDSRLYPVLAEGRELFTEYGQPHVWHKNGPMDQQNMKKFIVNLGRPSPW